MSASPSAEASARSHGELLTLGVEEEFLLLDAATGEVAPVAPQVLTLLGGEPGIKLEFMRYQLETTTGICTTLDEVYRDITRLREITADATAQLGYLLVASGVVPLSVPGLSALTDDPRYGELARRYPLQAAGCGTCACHVHIGIPSRELGVQVLARLRPWLATLLALTANSPIADGRDTSWSSWRYRRWCQWPSAIPPRAWRDVRAYDAAVHNLIRGGRALDERGIYFHARLSPRYPTVEVRIMDACLTSEDTLLAVALVRGLVAAALDEARRGLPVEHCGRIAAGLASAARHGLDGQVTDPHTGCALRQRDLTNALLNRITDAEPVAQLLDRLHTHGTGAARQRAMWSKAAELREFTRLLAEATRAH
ncbi:YbdK family carboxylate-amine ligase [Nonomuraea sp. NPDC000554]|uniref:carboxylate-amine ligase n=1 Tax=Nonomuraea sp. NPDC000554 TaxID=3154259 RepID=UPI003327140B